MKYWAIARVTLATQTAYLGEIAVRTVFLAMVLYIFVQLWTVTYAAMGRQTVAGFSVAQMIWYLTVTESILLSRPRVSREIDQDVRSGDVAYQLIRPYDYVLFRLAAYLGERALRFGSCLAIGTALALLYVGPIELDAAAVLAAGLVVLVGAVVDFMGAVAIGLCAFWVEDTQPLQLLYDRSIMLLGGLLLPLELFPDWIARILAALPFQLILYAPARIAVTGDLSGLSLILAQLAVTLAVAYALARGVFALATRRLHANGG
ncbi:MAG TPA: ABC-2 family transporter protein [Chloroflexota bacterium]|jgi:ABC-2 type transport system permease protein|nr:ABC-2 family transporter protein [Chloroflexota bacterium]